MKTLRKTATWFVVIAGVLLLVLGIVAYVMRTRSSVNGSSSSSPNNGSSTEYIAATDVTLDCDEVVF